jgi:hypothetical protein
MHAAIEATVTIPGSRIGGYRNSSPRHIRLLGLGLQGTQVVRKVAARRRPNVEVLTNANTIGWDEIATDRPGTATNMVVIVCAEGDERLFRPQRSKPDMLVTFVLLREPARAQAARDPIANVRGFSDLFVTTSDADYVADLIDNLAS